MHFRLTITALLLACSALPAAAMAGAQGDAKEGALPLETCELVVPGTPLTVTAQCGWLEVAENPDDPDGRHIKIHVARVPARGRVTEADPLVFFAGGPGQAATETWPIVAHALRKVNDSRDILLVDQRGTGKSNPLKCPRVELEQALVSDWDQLAEATRECLEGVHGDPRYYTTTIATGDVDAARAALGYEKVNLYGGSYGTRAAQVYLRLYPQQVRTMVLDGVVPQTLALGSEHAQKLDQSIHHVLQSCDSDPECGDAFPRSSEKLMQLVQDLEQSPVEVTVPHPTTGQPFTLAFDRDVLASSLRFLSYSSDTQAMLPLLISEAATRHRFDRLASQMLIAATGLQESIAQGMEMSVVCSEDYPWFPKNQDLSRYLMGNAMLKSVEIQCGIWPAGPVPENFHEPVESDVPTLLLSGELDPVTPPEYAEQVAAHLGDARLLVAPGQGHIAINRGCMGDLVAQFIIDGGSENLDTGCISQMQYTPYFISLTGPTP